MLEGVHGELLMVRPPGADPVLVHFAGGLWGDGNDRVLRAFGRERVLAVGIDDAVHHYACNSRQVRGGVLVPEGVSAGFEGALNRLGLETRRVPLFELFGKAGGGPGCATLYLPTGLPIPANAPFRYSATREAVRARRERIPARLSVSPEFFRGKRRG
jgi:hypothetical protein